MRPVLDSVSFGPGVGRGTGVPGLPESDDWTTWDAGQMRAAVEYLEHLHVG